MDKIAQELKVIQDQLDAIESQVNSIKLWMPSEDNADTIVEKLDQIIKLLKILVDKE